MIIKANTSELNTLRKHESKEYIEKNDNVIVLAKNM